MTIKLPRITAAEIIRVLEKEGFFLARQGGKHRIYKNSEGKRVTVSYHPGKILHPKVVQNIIRDADIPLNKLKELL